MYQRTIGTKGPAVGAIGIGGMPLSISKDRPDEADAIHVLSVAAEVGMTLWDTADAYALDDTEAGHNERLFAKALASLPSELKQCIVLATKGGHIRPGGAWETDGRPAHLKEAVDHSLKALGVDCIDLYQFHRPDPETPFEDSIGAMAEILHAGKTRFIGLSNVSAAQIDAALAIVPVISVQNQYSLFHREPEFNGVIEKCRERGLAFLPYSPLGGISRAKGIGKEGALAQVADELDVSPQQVVLAWHLTKYAHSIPIPGVSKVASVRDSAEADNIRLSESQIQQLEAAYP